MHFFCSTLITQVFTNKWSFKFPKIVSIQVFRCSVFYSSVVNGSVPWAYKDLAHYNKVCEIVLFFSLSTAEITQ